jgi:hypothetical protein
MQKDYLTTAHINASPEAVWKVLTDAPGYASWNPEIIALQGRLAQGERIKASVNVKAGPGKTAVRSVSLRVTAFSPPIPGPRDPHAPVASMEWTGGIRLGLFTGRRTLTVSPKAGGAEFRMQLNMRGPLLKMILKSVGDRQPEIDSFSAALKARVEGLPRQ